MKKNSSYESFSQALKKIRLFSSLAVFVIGILVSIIVVMVNGVLSDGTIIIAIFISAGFALFFYVFIDEDISKIIKEEEKEEEKKK